MSKLLQKGIEQATEDLRRENDEAIWQEGVLRHVPIVGSLYNWMLPLQKVKIVQSVLDLNFCHKITQTRLTKSHVSS